MQVKFTVWLVVVGLIAVAAGQINSPLGCAKWYSGYDYHIEWDPEAFPGATVSLDLYAADETTLIAHIASGVTNNGDYLWLVPYLQYGGNYDFSQCSAVVVISTGGTSFSSGGFTIANPITFGDFATRIFAPYNVLDTLFKVRWSGEIVPRYVVQYHIVGSGSVSEVPHASDRSGLESMEDLVISGLRPNTTYEFRMAYFRDELSGISAWTTWIPVTTYPELDCSDRLVSAWFSLEVYDNIRTGEHKYPGFCGDWETALAFVVSPDYAAVYVERDTGRAVVAYRGTVFSDLADQAENIGVLVPCSSVVHQSDTDCLVSSGFGLAYVHTASIQIQDLINGFIQDGFLDLVVTGHSQGAAIATVALMDFEALYSGMITISAITFGGPQPGNDVFGNLIASYGALTRVVQADEVGVPDEVTTLPSSAAGYLPPYFTDGFSQIPNIPLNVLCPTFTICRANGAGPLPPFYCHCVGGYWNNIALLSIVIDFSSTSYSTDEYIYVDTDSFSTLQPTSDQLSHSLTTVVFAPQAPIDYTTINSAFTLVPVWGLVALLFVMLF